MVEALFIAAGVVFIVVFTVWFVWHGRCWAKRTSRWDIPGVDKPMRDDFITNPGGEWDASNNIVDDIEHMRQRWLDDE